MLDPPNTAIPEQPLPMDQKPEPWPSSSHFARMWRLSSSSWVMVQEVASSLSSSAWTRMSCTSRCLREGDEIYDSSADRQVRHSCLNLRLVHRARQYSRRARLGSAANLDAAAHPPAGARAPGPTFRLHHSDSTPRVVRKVARLSVKAIQSVVRPSRCNAGAMPSAGAGELTSERYLSLQDTRGDSAICVEWSRPAPRSGVTRRR